MKNIFTTIAIGLLMLSAKANHFSALNLKMFDNGNFSVVLDNQPSYQSNFFSAKQIQPGYHKLKVFRFFSNPYGYSLVRKMVYNGWINIPAKAVVFAQIDCHSQFDIVKVEPMFPSNGWSYNNGWQDGCDDDEYGSDYENNYNGYIGGTNTGYESGNSGWGYNSTTPLMPMGMYEMQFMQLKQSIASKDFESSKLQIAKQALAQNYFTSAQIADLMSLFSFEATKLDFAKSAYVKVIDKQNFYLVNNAFTYESSIQELNQYIAGK